MPIYNIPAGGASKANQVNYDNTESGLQATNVQGAIDEINNKISKQKIVDNTMFNGMTCIKSGVYSVSFEAQASSTNGMNYLSVALNIGNGKVFHNAGVGMQGKSNAITTVTAVGYIEAGTTITASVNNTYNCNTPTTMINICPILIN